MRGLRKREQGGARDTGEMAHIAGNRAPPTSTRAPVDSTGRSNGAWQGSHCLQSCTHRLEVAPRDGRRRCERTTCDGWAIVMRVMAVPPPGCPGSLQKQTRVPALEQSGVSGSQAASIHWCASPSSSLGPSRTPFTSEALARAGALPRSRIHILATSGRTSLPLSPGSATVGNRRTDRDRRLGGGRCVRIRPDRIEPSLSCFRAGHPGLDLAV